MSITIKQLNGGAIIFQQEANIKLDVLEVIERKGWGHPDKLADDLAESLSQAYSKYTLVECGAILHHNFDKLCLLGGSSKVTYGYGEMINPIRVLVNGRASMKFGGKSLNIEDLIIQNCKKFFRTRFPLLDVDKDITIELNLSTASSPGKVYSQAAKLANSRHQWFEPTSLSDLPERYMLHANDTSLGTGYAPLSSTENLVKMLVDHLSNNNSKFYKWMGTDIKIMACRIQDKIDIIGCVPQIAGYVNSRQEYIENILTLHKLCQELIKTNFPQLQVNFTFNTRDKLEADEIYLTAIGSSIESGDEGIVGRGNRVNGLITPMRPMNLEGANGKNPVYHVGKLYNVLANQIAQTIHQKFGGNVVVNLISKTGSEITVPWKILLQTENKNLPKNEVVEIVESILPTIPELTLKIIEGEIELS